MHEKAKGKALCTGKVRTATGAGAAAGAVEQLLHNETDAPFEWLRLQTHLGPSVSLSAAVGGSNKSAQPRALCRPPLPVQ